MIGTARHYEDVDITRYDEAEVVCDLDTDESGARIIRIEALSGDPDEYPLGRPGVSIELSMDDAIDLMVRLSEVTMPENPMIVGEAIDGEALMRGECQTGDLCWFHAVEPGFFKVDPTPGHHDDLKDAMDCRKRAKNLQS